MTEGRMPRPIVSAFLGLVIGLFLGIRARLFLSEHRPPESGATPLPSLPVGHVERTCDAPSSSGRASDELTKWRAMLDMWDKEADRFWTRSNIFLLLHGALLVVVSSFPTSPAIGVGLSVFGIAFVVIWMRVNRIGKFYLDRWKILLTEMEERWDAKIVGRLPEIGRTHPVASTHRSSTTYMLYVLWLLLLVWVFLLVITIGEAVSNWYPLILTCLQTQGR